jgi:peptidoglycan/xylan/chitin deacetylase (PgdA/CDA1 family)
MCVFTLHRITDERTRDHDLSWASFRAFLRDVLQEAGEVVTQLDPPAAGPRAVLTFDDATDDHRAAADELLAHGLRGLFFVPTAKLGEPGRLRADDVAALARDGHAIGSHADRHVPLSTLSATDIEREVGRSSERIAELVDTPPRYFAPPGGIGHPALSSTLGRHGFVASRSMRWGVYRAGDDPWEIGCIPVTEATLARGWVRSALAHGRLAGTMRAAWLVKSALPRPVAGAVRRALHEVPR